MTATAAAVRTRDTHLRRGAVSSASSVASGVSSLASSASSEVSSTSSVTSSVTSPGSAAVFAARARGGQRLGLGGLGFGLFG